MGNGLTVPLAFFFRAQHNQLLAGEIAHSKIQMCIQWALNACESPHWFTPSSSKLRHNKETRRASQHLLSPHRLGSRAALIIGVTASRFVKSLAFFLLFFPPLCDSKSCQNNSITHLHFRSGANLHFQFFSASRANYFLSIMGESGMIVVTFLGAMGN